MIDEGKATLRLKQDMQSDNKNMYDLIAYRIKVSCSCQTRLDTYDHLDSQLLSDFMYSLLPIHMRVTSGVYIQVMTILIASWILSRTSHIQYVVFFQDPILFNFQEIDFYSMTSASLS